MRIVQTFWSAGRNPLEYSFGWLRPEYNLMSWALSLLSLREHYDEVALYADEQGNGRVDFLRSGARTWLDDK